MIARWRSGGQTPRLQRRGGKTTLGCEGSDPHRHCDGGFTLVEVLVSLVLLALVLALLSGALRFARGTWDAAARLDEQAGFDRAESFLRARLGEAMPLYEHRTAGTVRVAFQGTGDALSFVAAAPNGPVGAGLYRYALEAVSGAAAGRRVLVVKVAPYQARQSESAAEWVSERHELVRNLKSVAFRYFGRGELRAQPAWHAAWTRTDAMPNLVEMTVARDDNEGGPLSLVVELRLQPTVQ